MNTVKINKFKTLLPNKGAFTIETEPDFPKLHTLCCVSGRRGGGKGVATSNFIKRCKDKNYFQRVYLISPTYESNKSIWDICDIDPSDVYEPTVDCLKTIKGLVEAEKEEWDSYIAKKEAYKRYQKDMKRRVLAVDPDDLMMYNDFGFFESPPEWKYPLEVPPRLALIIDDAMGTDLYNKPSAGLTNFCIKHRHIGQGLGISVFMLVQSYCAIGSVPRPVRENTTLLLLFKINDENQIKKVKEEADLPITDEEWDTMTQQVFSEDYNFLLCDFAAKCPTKMFRSGWDNYIQVPSLMDKCKCKK